MYKLKRVCTFAQNKSTKTNIMTYLQATEMANKEHERSLELLNSGQLSKYVESYKLVTELNKTAECLKG